MVYIYKKKVCGKNQYYLRASERKGERMIIKDIAYLGSDITKVKERLNNLKEYKTEIRKAYKTIHKVIESNIWLEKAKTSKPKINTYLKELTTDIEACRIHFTQVFNKKEYLTKKETFEQFAIDFSYNTTSLEGNTIKLNEARKLLTEGLTPKNRSIREIYDVQNTKDVFLDWEEFDINHESIIDIHKLLMKNIDQRIGYRTEDVRVFKSHFDSTPAPYVKIDMDLLLKWYEKYNSKLHPLVLASLFHHKFEKIHPFMDGNGRTGKMLMNLILLKHDFPPVIIETKLRSQYLEALSKADKTDSESVSVQEYFPLVQFVAKELLAGYWNIFL